MGKKLGTLLVSNPSTFVERIYFNTALTKDEVNALFLNNPSFTDNEVYSPFSVGDSNNYIQVVVYKEKGYVTINALVNGSIVGIFGSDGWRDTFSGVSSKYLEFNKYGVAEVSGSEVGTKNDLLRLLFSMNSDFKDTSTDIETLLYYIGEAIKTKKGSTEKINAQDFASEILALSTGGSSEVTQKPVPNSGYVENVYFNTNLSVDEVVSLLSQLTYYTDGNENYSILQPLNAENVETPVALLVIKDLEGINYVIMNVIYETIYFISNDPMGLGFVGWNPSFTNPIPINFDVTNISSEGTSVGAENDKLSNLISIEPFE